MIICGKSEKFPGKTDNSIKLHVVLQHATLEVWNAALKRGMANTQNKIKYQEDEYGRLLNQFLQDSYGISLEEGHALGGRLRREISRRLKKCKGIRGTDFYKLREKSFTINIPSDCLKNPADVQKKLIEMEIMINLKGREVEDLKENLKVRNAEVDNLRNQIENVGHEHLKTEKDLKEANLKINQLSDSNRALQAYIQKITGIEMRTTFNKLDFASCPSSQKNNLKKQIVSQAEWALWFLKSFGLQFDSILAKDSQSIAQSHHKLLAFRTTPDVRNLMRKVIN
jgi:hypothetical protein